MVKNVKIKWQLEGETTYEEVKVLFIENDVILYPDVDGGLLLQRAAKSLDGSYVFLDELAHLNDYNEDKGVRSLKMEEIEDLSAVGMFKLIAKLAGDAQ